jgi:hypothetical protein
MSSKCYRYIVFGISSLGVLWIVAKTLLDFMNYADCEAGPGVYDLQKSRISRLDGYDVDVVTAKDALAMTNHMADIRFPRTSAIDRRLSAFAQPSPMLVRHVATKSARQRCIYKRVV